MNNVKITIVDECECTVEINTKICICRVDKENFEKELQKLLDKYRI
jgi:hypothetical protein